MVDTTRTLIEAIDEIKALISSPVHWTKGSLARDANNIPVMVDSEDATCWCLLGAREKVLAKYKDPSVVTDLSNKLYTALSNVLPDPFFDPVNFNDTTVTTHSDIMSVLDRAKARLESNHG
jgi:hypothetical protein